MGDSSGGRVVDMATLTALNVSYNATIAPGASTTFGFQGTYSGANTTPAQFTLNGTACTTA